MKTVVLEGAGDTVDKHYFPALQPWIETGEVHLWMTDTTRRPWAMFKPNAKVPQEIFLYKGDRPFKSHQRDYQFWRNLTAQVVFVVTPDRYHCETAQHWLPSADLIIVDKAFAPTTAMIDELLQAINQSADSLRVEAKIKGFDHYRVSALPLRGQVKELISQIGGLSEVEFKMLEAGGVEKHRRGLPGMIEDFTPHLFALLDLIGDLRNLRITKAARSQYPSAWPARDPERKIKETFACVDFSSLTHYSPSKVKGTAWVGKGVGTNDEKFLDLIGPNGKVRIDFRRTGPRDIALYRREGDGFRWLERVAYLYDGHQEMINRTIKATPDCEECYFSTEEAKAIIAQVENIYHIVSPPKEEDITIKYQTGESVETIIERLKREERRRGR